MNNEKIPHQRHNKRIKSNYDETKVEDKRVKSAKPLAYNLINWMNEIND